MESEAQPTAKRGEGDIWVRKCDLLKRKCEEYEQVRKTISPILTFYVVKVLNKKETDILPLVIWPLYEFGDCF